MWHHSNTLMFMYKNYNSRFRLKPSRNASLRESNFSPINNLRLCLELGCFRNVLQRSFQKSFLKRAQGLSGSLFFLHHALKERNYLNFLRNCLIHTIKKQNVWFPNARGAFTYFVNFSESWKFLRMNYCYFYCY